MYNQPGLISDSVKAIVKEPKTVFLLDVSWLLHRGWNAIGKAMTAGQGGRPTGHMYSFLKTITMIEAKMPGSVIVFCKDGKPVRRQKLMEGRTNEYKADRPELEYNFYQDYDKILAAASLLGNVFEAFLPDQESDDLMSNLARQIAHISPESFVYVYSGDDDLLQTIDDGHSCVLRKWDAKTGEPIKIDNLFLKMDDRMLEKYHGVDSYHLPYYRAICGDKSDKIAGIPRFNRDAAKAFAMHSNCIDDLFLLHLSDELKGYMPWKHKLRENEKLVRENFELMALRQEFKVDLIKYSPDARKVIGMLDKLRLNSYVHYLKERGI